MSTFPTSPITKHKDRVATRPLRILAYALTAAVFIVEFVQWSLGWCGDVPILSFFAPLFIIFGLFVFIESWEQRTFISKPAFAIAIAALVIRIGLTEASAFFGCSGFHTFFAFIPPLLAFMYIGRRAAILTAIINIALYVNWLVDEKMTNTEILLAENIIVELFIFLVGMILVLVLGQTLVLAEESRERAETLVGELEQSQRQVAELAAVDERNRIARDIHDSVGHHLTAVNIMLEKAQAFREINPEEADRALLDAKRSAKLALTDVRESVSALRDPETQYELGPALQQLVDGFGRIPTKLTFSGDEEPFAKSTLLALYRVAQEGLTNIEKHAGATSAELHVALQPDHGTLVLKDNGKGVDVTALEAKSAQGDAHFGLTGLRERLELLGGTLTVTSEKNNGMALHVRVPAKGLA